MSDEQNKKLKPLSGYEKGLLSLLDEDPAEHQRRMLKRLRGEKPDPILKKLQDGTAKIGPTIAEAALALEQRVALWREDAYCIFISHTTCKNCGRKSLGQMDPQVYLRSRKTRKDETNPYMYVPVKGISNWSLPRLRVATFNTVFTCEFCFEGLQCLPSAKPSPAGTASPEVPPNSSDESSPSTPDTQPYASILEEGIETSSLSSGISGELGTSSETSPLPNSELPETTAPAAPTDSRISEEPGVPRHPV